MTPDPFKIILIYIAPFFFYFSLNFFFKFPFPSLPSFLFSHFVQLFSCLHSLSQVSYLTFSLISSSYVSCEVVQLITIVQSWSTNLLCPKSLDMLHSLYLPPTFLTSSTLFIHPLLFFFSSLALTATPSPSHKE